MRYDKLVRDDIPDIIESTGKKCKYHTADPEEYYEKLKEKLLEEVQEFLLTPNVEELADIEEVIYSISAFKQWDIKGTQIKKNRMKGAFYRRFILEEVEE